MGWEWWQRHSLSDFRLIGPKSVYRESIHRFPPEGRGGRFLSGSDLGKCWSNGHMPGMQWALLHPAHIHRLEVSPLFLSWPPPQDPVALAAGMAQCVSHVGRSDCLLNSWVNALSPARRAPSSPTGSMSSVCEQGAVNHCCCSVVGLKPLTSGLLFLLCTGIDMWLFQGVTGQAWFHGESHSALRHAGLVLKARALRAQLGTTPCDTRPQKSRAPCPSCPSSSPSSPLVSWESQYCGHQCSSLC